MLRDVLETVRDAGGDPVILATRELEAPFDVAGTSFNVAGTSFDANGPSSDDNEPAPDLDTSVIVDDRPLSEAVAAHIDGPTAVVMSDLAIATPTALRRVFEMPADGEIAGAPGLGGGTNVLVVRHRDFVPDYHGTSFADHRRAADDIGAPFRPVDSFRLAVDVDGPDDLPEVLLHGTGRAADWLDDAGFEVAIENGIARAIRRNAD